jgi:hypothetical protein
MNNKSYGYYFDLSRGDKEELEHLISFDNKTDISYYIKNYNYIRKLLTGQGWNKTYEEKYKTEIEYLFEKENKKIFLYKEI